MAQSKDQVQELNDHLDNMESLQEGQIIKGTILEIDEKNGNVFVDINYKSEGILSLSEFSHPPKKGDEVEVFLIRHEWSNGLPQVSKAKADEIRFRKNLRDSMEVGQVIEGRIKSQIKGGFSVALSHGVEAFLPASKVDIYTDSDLSSYVGLKSPFVINQFKIEGSKNYNIVLDRRAYLKEQMACKKEEFFKTYREGDIVEGIVKEFVSFGAFVDLGGFDGLLHTNDMSWGHNAKPRDFVEKGQTLKLKTVHLDAEKGRINLSLKDMQDNPWDHIREYFREGDVVKGKVTKLTTFGAFVELTKNIEGLVHLSEFSWTKKINDPKEVVFVGQEIQVKILEISEDKKRVALGIKQLKSNPWEALEEDFPVGKELELKVVKILPTAAILQIQEGLEAYLPISEMSWTFHFEKMEDALKVGEVVKVKIIQVSGSDRSIRVSIKQLEASPWASFRVGSEIEVKIKEKKDSIWLASVGEVKAIIPRSGVAVSSTSDFEKANSEIEVGDTVKAIIQKVEPRKREIVVSIREYFRTKERGEISQYMASQKEESEGYNPFASLKTK